MTDQQIQQFIFQAGFSTAAKVTSVSGRGVGMDVVRTNIEKIGGTIELKSDARQGLDLHHQDPADPRHRLGADRRMRAASASPSRRSASSSWCAPRPNSEHRIERINDAPVLRLRDRLLPLVSLQRAAASSASRADEPARPSSSSPRSAPTRFGIIVDRVFDTEEIVVKPVAPILRDITHVLRQHHPRRRQRDHDPRSQRHRRRRPARSPSSEQAQPQRGGDAPRERASERTSAAAVPRRRRRAEGGAAGADRAPRGDRRRADRARRTASRWCSTAAS